MKRRPFAHAVLALAAPASLQAQRPPTIRGQLAARLWGVRGRIRFELHPNAYRFGATAERGTQGVSR